MKKILVLGLLCVLIQGTVEARDYAKLQAKEIKHAQKYSTSDKILDRKNLSPQITSNMNIKDPKLIKIGDYQEVSDIKYKEKLAKDNTEYAKIEKNLMSSKTDNYHRQAYSSDFYRIYRICERIIRANNLDFVDWRITVQSSQDFNAYNSNMNNVTILTGLYDTFASNEDALALVIGHEMGHALHGHSARKAKMLKKLNRSAAMGAGLAYLAGYKKFLIESKNMEYAADIEGAKLVAKAGYNLDNARENITFMNTLDDGSMERHSTHPNATHRLQNYDQNRKYFPINEWTKQGKYNIYNSEVHQCQKSSDRKSIVIKRGKSNSQNNYYKLESVTDIYKRYGYMAYLNGEFKNAIKYFKKVLDENKNDYSIYLYMSYAYEYLGDKESAKLYADYAKNLAPNNKYVNEQLNAL